MPEVTTLAIFPVAPAEDARSDVLKLNITVPPS